MLEFIDSRLDVRGVGSQLVGPGQPPDLHLEEVPGRQAVGEQQVRLERVRVDSLAPALADLHVLAQSSDDLEDVLRVLPLVPHRLLHRLHEGLLAGEAIEVGVRVSIADEVERLPAREPLVTGPEIDRCVVPTLRVEVAAVDVHRDAADLVDHLPEALEVDSDQVVDRQAGHGPDGFQCPLGAAIGVRRVDAIDGGAAVRAANLDDQVTGEGEQRERVPIRISSKEHQRV